MYAIKFYITGFQSFDEMRKAIPVQREALESLGYVVEQTRYII